MLLELQIRLSSGSLLRKFAIEAFAVQVRADHNVGSKLAPLHRDFAVGLFSSPPHTQTGMLKRILRCDVTYNRTVVAIGPVNEIAARIWNLHEFGGVATKRRKLKPHRFRVGEHGPIRATQHGTKTNFSRIQLRTAAQANRATRLIAEKNERRSATRPRHYPKRPFMSPPLEGISMMKWKSRKGVQMIYGDIQSTY